MRCSPAVALALTALALICLAIGLSPLAGSPAESDGVGRALGSGDPVVIAAGDIAACGAGHTGDEATAALLAGIAGTVLTLGDNAYPNGTASEFTNCYSPS